ncbi:MAG: hypothetical protein V3S64_14405, partial [bacterium]
MMVRCIVVLSFALWVLTAASSPWAQAPAQAPSALLETAPDPPVEAPGSLGGADADPGRGIRFGLGFPMLEVSSDSLNQDLKGGK